MRNVSFKDILVLGFASSILILGACQSMNKPMGRVPAQDSNGTGEVGSVNTLDQAEKDIRDIRSGTLQSSSDRDNAYITGFEASAAAFHALAKAFDENLNQIVSTYCTGIITHEQYEKGLNKIEALTASYSHKLNKLTARSLGDNSIPGDTEKVNALDEAIFRAMQEATVNPPSGSCSIGSKNVRW